MNFQPRIPLGPAEDWRIVTRRELDELPVRGSPPAPKIRIRERCAERDAASGRRPVVGNVPERLDEEAQVLLAGLEAPDRFMPHLYWPDHREVKQQPR